MDKVIHVSHKVIYGKSRFYPQNGVAKAFAKLMRMETFWASDLEQMKALGFEIEIVSVSFDQFMNDEKKKKAKKKSEEGA